VSETETYDWKRIDLALWSVEDIYKDARTGRVNAKCFELQRKVDVSGISGTGIVAEGVEFPNGKVLIKWLGDRPSLVLWQSIEHAQGVHGHNGGTDFVYTIPGA
jgi:hypothetical protein